MSPHHPWAEPFCDRFFERSLDQAVHAMVNDYLARHRISPRRLGKLALGKPGFISGWRLNGATMLLKNCDGLLGFMGEPPFRPYLLRECEAFLAATGFRAYVVGRYSLKDPSFLCRLRKGRSPRLTTLANSRLWMGNHCTAEQRRMIWRAVMQDVAPPGIAAYSIQTDREETTDMLDEAAYLNTAQAAKRVGLSKRTLERLRVTGGGPRYSRIANRIRYTPEDLDAWVLANRRKSTSDDGSDEDGSDDNGSGDGGAGR